MKVSKIIAESDLTLEQFADIVNLDNIDQYSTVPSDDDIKKEAKINKTASTIGFLQGKYKNGNEKIFKKIGKVYYQDKRVKKMFKSIYLEDKIGFKDLNYAHFLTYLKKEGKI